VLSASALDFESVSDQSSEHIRRGCFLARGNLSDFGRGVWRQSQRRG
jgi:hypothetical protein